MAHKPNNDGARNNGERSSSGQRRPVHAGGGHGPRHGGHDGFGVHAGEGARQQQLHPAEHEAEKGGHAYAGTLISGMKMVMKNRGKL